MGEEFLSTSDDRKDAEGEAEGKGGRAKKISMARRASRSIASPWKIVVATGNGRGSTGTIEEVVTNKVSGERIRVAELKNDGPPLVAATVR